MKRVTPLVVFALALVCSTVVSAAEWGDLKLKFVYDGAAPSPTPINVNKDVQFCGQFGLVDEEVVVNKENGGIANVAVFLYTRGDGPTAHPDYASSAEEKVVLDNEKCRFEPRIAVLQPGQPLVIKNSDSVGHNTKIDTFSNPPINNTIPAGAELTVKYDAAERIVAAPVGCSIHPWMKGYLIIKDTPYAAISNRDGEVFIKNLPVGAWTFQLWHETGYVQQAKLNGKPVEWKRGRAEFTIKPGMNDLGEIKYKP